MVHLFDVCLWLTFSVKHWKEVDGKSTATHAKILAPDRVTIYEFPTSVPCYPDISRVILLYPLEV